MPTRLVLATAWPCRRRRPSLRWRIISSCSLGRAPPRGVRRFAAQSVRAKICVWWQPWAVLESHSSARAATFCVPMATWGCVRVPAHTAPHGVPYLSKESSRTSRRLYGVCCVQTRDRGPAARATKAAGTQPKPRKLPKASLRLLYGCALSVWTASTWPPLSFGQAGKEQRRRCQLGPLVVIHRYRGAMQPTRPALLTTKC